MKRVLLVSFILLTVSNLISQTQRPELGINYPGFFAVDQPVSKSQALNLMKQLLDLNASDQMKLLNAQPDEIGYVHEKFQQYYKGIVVHNATYSVHSKNGEIKALSGSFVDILNLDVTPSLPPSLAFTKALDHVKAKVYAWEPPVKGGHPGYEKPTGKLVVVADEAKRLPPTLAYMFDIYAEQPLYRANVFIDAKTGAFLKEDQLIHEGNVAATAATRYNGTKDITADLTSGTYRLRQAATSSVGAIETYNLQNKTTYTGALDITSSTNSFTTDPTANSAHWAADRTYTYYKSRHGRNSYNNAGGAIKSYVHYSTNYVNAFWDGTRMTYGDGDGTSYGPLVSLDICGHEITHGVTETSANLTYSYESGALNESFSDIFGESIENFAKGSNDWLMGKDITMGNVNPFRSMINPKAYGDPDTYKGINWYSGTGDNGGVHTNSGVQNKWFYILAAGESGTNDFGNAYNVTGLGLTKAAAIAYRNLTVYLSASSNYAAARSGAIQAATDLYGPGSAEVIATTNAWYAVGVGCAYGANCYCASGGNNSSYEWIKTVSIGSFTNNSGAAGYTNFTNLTINLAAGSNNAVTLTPGFAGVTYNEYWKIWIDFNADGDFDDAGEFVFGAGLSKSAVSGNIAIPANATGTTRMRVSMKYNAQQTACESFAYGEVEDYTVAFTGAVDTEAPSAPLLSSTGSTETTIGLSWTAATDNVGVTGYDVYANNVLKGSTTGTTFTLTGLTAGTSYSLYVKAKDAAGNSTASNTIDVSTKPAVDNQPPSAPVLNSSTITQNTIALSWNASTDNVGVTGYDIYVDNALNGSTTTTSYTVSGLTAGTPYSIYVKAKDAAGNSTASNTITASTLPASTATTLSAHYFETGWDGWSKGGNDCNRYSGSRSPEGQYSIMIRDNSGIQSSMTSSNYNVTAYNKLTVEFKFYATGMANGHDFWLNYYDGSSWATVKTFVAGTDFNNNSVYQATVNITGVAFPSNAQFRFQCDANGNNNQVYIDAVVITGSTGATLAEGITKSVVPVANTNSLLMGPADKLVRIYPNPVATEMSIDAPGTINSIRIYTIDGRLIKLYRGLTRQNKIDVSGLKQGQYVMIIETNTGTVSRKFLKN